MTPSQEGHEAPTRSATEALSARAKVVVITTIVILFAVLLAIRSADGAGSDLEALPGNQESDSAEDPVLVYEEALESDRPIYVLFLSRTCAPCVEIGRVAIEVLPDYDDSINFVSVSTDDPRSRPLFSRFQFQYIPTSFFLAPDGIVVDQHTGVLSEPQMRERLDSLVESFGAEAMPADSED